METFTARVATKTILEVIKDILTLLTGSDSYLTSFKNRYLKSRIEFLFSAMSKSLPQTVTLKNASGVKAKFLIWRKFWLARVS